MPVRKSEQSSSFRRGERGFPIETQVVGVLRRRGRISVVAGASLIGLGTFMLGAVPARGAVSIATFAVTATVVGACVIAAVPTVTSRTMLNGGIFLN
jgi:hypothetical protein